MDDLTIAAADRERTHARGGTASAASQLEERLGRLLGHWTLRRLASGLGLGGTESLSAREIALVSRLALDGPLTVKELVADFRMPHSTMSAVVDRLETRGLVKRRALPRDRRSTLLQVTDEARETLLRSASTLPADASLDALAPDERRALESALGALEKTLTRDSD